MNPNPNVTAAYPVRSWAEHLEALAAAYEVLGQSATTATQAIQSLGRSLGASRRWAYPLRRRNDVLGWPLFLRIDKPATHDVLDICGRFSVAVDSRGRRFLIADRDLEAYYTRR